MPALVCVGHNTVDKYVNLGMMFPGGNEVNVAALASRYGVESSYVGCVGQDGYGELIVHALQTEGVDISHCHVMDDVNTYTEIFLEDGERTFGKIRRGASTSCVVGVDDTQFILKHEMLHTGFYSRMEEFLKLYKDEIKVSFDFTEYAEEKYILELLPFVDIAYISIKPDTEVKIIEDRAARYYDVGPEVVILTAGETGGYLYDGVLYYQPAIQMEEVVDTLGAGDSFIARYLVEYHSGTRNRQALNLATEAAARTCGYFGAFGHGIEIKD